MGILTESSSIKAWQDAQAASDFQQLENGNYVASLDSVKYHDGYGEQKESIVYEFTVADGECQGARFRSTTFIRDVSCFGYIKRDLTKLGCTIPQQPADLPLALQQAVGRLVAVRVINKKINDKTYMNVYFDGLAGSLTAGQPKQQSQQYQTNHNQQPQQYTSQPQQQQRTQYRQPQPQQQQSFNPAQWDQYDEAPF